MLTAGIAKREQPGLGAISAELPSAGQPGALSPGVLSAHTIAV